MRKTMNSEFVTKLLTLLPDKDNSVISPRGIATVLAMASEGANEDSLFEILGCLGFSSIDELRKTMVDTIANPCDAFTSENAITLVKGKAAVGLREPFKQILISQYAADISEENASAETSIQLKNVATFKAAS